MVVREIPIRALALEYVVVDTPPSLSLSSPPCIPPGYAGPATFESEGSWQRSLGLRERRPWETAGSLHALTAEKSGMSEPLSPGAMDCVAWPLHRKRGSDIFALQHVVAASFQAPQPSLSFSSSSSTPPTSDCSSLETAASSGFNFSLQTAPGLLEGVREGIETRGDGCVPSTRALELRSCSLGPQHVDTQRCEVWRHRPVRNITRDDNYSRFLAEHARCKAEEVGDPQDAGGAACADEIKGTSSKQPAICSAKSADGEAGFYHASRWRDEPKAAEQSVKPTPVVAELESKDSNANEVRSNQAVARAERDSADGAAERQVGLSETGKATRHIAAWARQAAAQAERDGAFVRAISDSDAQVQVEENVQKEVQRSIREEAVELKQESPEEVRGAEPEPMIVKQQAQKAISEAPPLPDPYRQNSAPVTPEAAGAQSAGIVRSEAAGAQSAGIIRSGSMKRCHQNLKMKKNLHTWMTVIDGEDTDEISRCARQRCLHKTFHAWCGTTSTVQAHVVNIAQLHRESSQMQSVGSFKGLIRGQSFRAVKTNHSTRVKQNQLLFHEMEEDKLKMEVKDKVQAGARLTYGWLRRLRDDGSSHATDEFADELVLCYALDGVFWQRNGADSATQLFDFRIPPPTKASLRKPSLLRIPFLPPFCLCLCAFNLPSLPSSLTSRTSLPLHATRPSSAHI